MHKDSHSSTIPRQTTNLRVGNACQKHFAKENMSTANKHMKICATSLVTRAVFSTGERWASLSQRLWAMSGDGCDCHHRLGGCLWHVGEQLHFPQCNRTALHAKNRLTSDVRSNKGETAEPDITAVCTAAGTCNSSCVHRLWMEEPTAAV